MPYTSLQLLLLWKFGGTCLVLYAQLHVWCGFGLWQARLQVTHSIDHAGWLPDR
jgi:hypothetical protein